MVDKETLIQILNGEQYLITKEDNFIPYDVFNILHDRAYRHKVDKIIEAKDGGYLCEFMCSRCGKIHTEKLSKSAIADGGRKIYCSDCANILKKEKEENEKAKQEEREKRNIKEEKDRTEYAISCLLNPNCGYKDGIKYYEKYDECLYYMTEEAVQYARKMPYKDFLRTPYWNAVRSKKLKQADYKCQLCGKSERLNVHHRCYDNRGNEIHHMNDLIVLCEDCHHNYHNK